MLVASGPSWCVLVGYLTLSFYYQLPSALVIEYLIEQSREIHLIGLDIQYVCFMIAHP